MVVDAAVAVKNASMMSGTLDVQVISAEMFDEK